MNSLQKIVTIAAASAVVGIGALAATPAAAFDPMYDTRNGSTWNDSNWGNRGWGDYNRSGYYGDNRYGYDNGYGRSGYDGGYNGNGYEVRSGAIAICPPTYHLGASGGLCWPD